MQIGSGIKVNTAVWEAVWPYGTHEAWELAAHDPVLLCGSAYDALAARVGSPPLQALREMAPHD